MVTRSGVCKTAKQNLGAHDGDRPRVRPSVAASSATSPNSRRCVGRHGHGRDKYEREGLQYLEEIQPPHPPGGAPHAPREQPTTQSGLASVLRRLGPHSRLDQAQGFQLLRAGPRNVGRHRDASGRFVGQKNDAVQVGRGGMREVGNSFAGRHEEPSPGGQTAEDEHRLAPKLTFPRLLAIAAFLSLTANGTRRY